MNHLLLTVSATVLVSLAVFSASLLGSVVGWWVVYKFWRFPKILAVPVAENDPCLARYRDAFKKAGL